MDLIIKILIALIVVVSICLIYYFVKWLFEGVQEYAEDVKDWRYEKAIRERG